MQIIPINLSVSRKELAREAAARIKTRSFDTKRFLWIGLLLGIVWAIEPFSHTVAATIVCSYLFYGFVRFLIAVRRIESEIIVYDCGDCGQRLSRKNLAIVWTTGRCPLCNAALCQDATSLGEPLSAEFQHLTTKTGYRTLASWMTIGVALGVLGCYCQAWLAPWGIARWGEVVWNFVRVLSLMPGVTVFYSGIIATLKALERLPAPTCSHCSRRIPAKVRHLTGRCGHCGRCIDSHLGVVEHNAIEHPMFATFVQNQREFQDAIHTYMFWIISGFLTWIVSTMLLLSWKSSFAPLGLFWPILVFWKYTPPREPQCAHCHLPLGSQIEWSIATGRCTRCGEELFFPEPELGQDAGKS